MPRLGRGGPEASSLGLGFWQAGSRAWGASRVSPSDVKAVVDAAISEGVNLFDTAEIYGGGRSEELLGRALKGEHARGSVVVVSKAAGFRVTSDSIVKAARGIARRLGFTPTVLLHHWPPPAWSDPCEPVRGLERAVAEGLAEYYGLSNYGERHLERALQCSRRLDPIVDQVQYSLAYRTPELGLKRELEERGMALMAWSPLAKGALAGLREPRTRAQRLDPVFKAAARDEELQKALSRVAGRHGATKAQAALAWLIAKKAFPIPGTLKPSRAREYAAAQRIKLTQQDIAELDEASRKYLTRWGARYETDFMKLTRVTPAILQKAFIRLLGGI